MITKKTGSSGNGMAVPRQHCTEHFVQWQCSKAQCRAWRLWFRPGQGVSHTTLAVPGVCWMLPMNFTMCRSVVVAGRLTKAGLFVKEETQRAHGHWARGNPGPVSGNGNGGWRERKQASPCPRWSTGAGFPIAFLRRKPVSSNCHGCAARGHHKHVWRRHGLPVRQLF
jgi:hypothetical protein